MARSALPCLITLLLAISPLASAVDARCNPAEACSEADMPEAVHANAMLQVKADKNKTAMMQLQSAHLAASSSCLSGGLQEAHLSALRQYAALLVNKSQDSYDPYTYDPYKPQTAYTPGVDGSNAEGTPAGFLAVTSLCCPLQTEMWFLRLLDYLDYQPCYQDQTIGTPVFQRWAEEAGFTSPRSGLPTAAGGQPRRHGSAIPQLRMSALRSRARLFSA